MEANPNIVFITLDQFRRDAMGAYGNKVIQTPNMDRIARAGTRFNNFVTPAAVCMPIRASMITGRFPSCHGVKSNGIPLPTNEVTFSEVLQRVGYHTGIIGKLHLVPKKIRRAYLPHPHYGFNTMMLAEGEHNQTTLGHRQSMDIVENCPDEYNSWLKTRDPDAFRTLIDTPYSYTPSVSPCSEEHHRATWVADRSIEFLERRAATGQPFYLNVSFFDPHPNFDPPEEFARMYDWRDMPEPVRRDGEHERRPTASYTRSMIDSLREKGLTGREWLKVRASYYGLVSFVDKQIGRVYDRLSELGILENTLIVLCADHGDMLGDHDLVEKGPFHYDPAIRVPLLVSWPNKLPENREVDEFVQHVDLAPTFLNAANAPIPAGVQGSSLLPVVAGEVKGYEATLTEDFGMLSVWAGLRQMTIRTRRLRFTHHYQETGGELFDLQEDPHELTNLYDDRDHAGTVSEMRAALIEKMISVADPLPAFETEY